MSIGALAFRFIQNPPNNAVRTTQRLVSFTITNRLCEPLKRSCETSSFFITYAHICKQQYMTGCMCVCVYVCVCAVPISFGKIREKLKLALSVCWGKFCYCRFSLWVSFFAAGFIFHIATVAAVAAAVAASSSSIATASTLPCPALPPPSLWHQFRL